jgi:hypothetical protein
MAEMMSKFSGCVYYIHTPMGYVGSVASREQARELDAHSVMICDEKETARFIKWGNEKANKYVLDKGFDLGFSRIDSSAFFERLEIGKKYVYFIEAVGLGRVKIGYSSDPTRRLRELNTASPTELIIFRSMPGNEQMEKDIHARFSHHRIKHEWFNFDDEIKDYAKKNCLY